MNWVEELARHQLKFTGSGTGTRAALFGLSLLHIGIRQEEPAIISSAADAAADTRATRAKRWRCSPRSPAQTPQLRTSAIDYIARFSSRQAQREKATSCRFKFR